MLMTNMHNGTALTEIISAWTRQPTTHQMTVNSFNWSSHNYHSDSSAGQVKNAVLRTDVLRIRSFDSFQLLNKERNPERNSVRVTFLFRSCGLWILSVYWLCPSRLWYSRMSHTASHLALSSLLCKSPKYKANYLKCIISWINLPIVQCEKFISLCALLFIFLFFTNPCKRPVYREGQGRKLAV